MSSRFNHTWLVLPAAGIGSRMQADRPKQYLQLTVNGETKTVIEQTLDHVLKYGKFHKTVVVVTKGDPYWQEISMARGYHKDERIVVVDGGSERCYSVLNALTAIQKMEDSEAAWVAVHDVARPCIAYSDLDKLFAAVQISEKENACDGAILAMPVRDTMKRGITSEGSNNVSSKIDHTVDRQQLWHALTPQVFPLAALLNNLESALKEGFEVTDEASAMEYAGAKPKLVSGRSDNLKITRPEDLKLAEFYLNLEKDKR